MQRGSDESISNRKKMTANGVLSLQGLPFEEGDDIEVIILSGKEKKHTISQSIVKGKVIEYKDPTEPVGQDDWETIK